MLLDEETADLIVLNIAGPGINDHYFETDETVHSLYWDLSFHEVIFFAQLKELRGPGFAVETLYKYKSLGPL